jgi:two-component system, chemotaxis family, chemotaxis protein CheY
MNSPIDYSNMHVLVVEDEPFMRDMVRRVLEMIGVTKITEATDGTDGLRKLVDASPDLIVLDIMMEPMNGLEFLKSVRTGLSNRRDYPVVVLTGSNDEAVLGTAMSLDCSAFVDKAVSLGEIKDRVARVIADPLRVRTQEAYQAVHIPDIKSGVVIKSRLRATAPPPSKAHEIPLEMVRPGSVLARDVYSDNGNVLLAEGTVLGISVLNNLRDISKIIEMPPLWVKL